jgi:hypothetical protein
LGFLEPSSIEGFKGLDGFCGLILHPLEDDYATVSCKYALVLYLKVYTGVHFFDLKL